jgi:NAD(P)-dependent dehydrogenase (short-subunit alcohol dehydrogenase family)
MSLNEKRVVILGGTSGIGFATAKAVLDDGGRVVVVSSRTEKVDAACTALGQGAEGQVADLSREAHIAALFERIGAFDHLVYTAGESLKLAPLETMNFEEAPAFLGIRFWGAFMAAKHAAPRIDAGGSITLTNGVAGLRPQKGWTLAASICGAMEALTRALAVDLAPLRVNAVCPGFVKTEMWDNLAADVREGMYRDVAARLPVGRIGVAEDLAEAFVYLMRERYSTGQSIVVDGGDVLV